MNHLSTPPHEAILPNAGDRLPLAPLLTATGLLALGMIVDLRMALAALAVLAAAVFVARTLERPLLGLLVMVGAASLDVVGRVANVSGVTLTLYQLCTFLTVVAVALAIRRGSLTPVAAPTDVPVLAFLGLVLVAIPAAIDPKLALVSAMSLISSAVMLVLVVWIVRDVPTARSVVLAVALAGLVLGVLAIAERQHLFAVQGSYLDLWKDGIRARATFKDPNILGSFLASSSLLAAAWGIGERKPLLRLAFLGCSFVAAAGILATLSRGAAGAWLIGVVAIVALSRLPLRWKVMAASVVALGITAAFAFVLDPAWVQDKIVGVTGNASAMYRVWMARGAIEMFKDFPMGIGPGNYPVLFPLYRDAVIKSNLIESHTAYLTILVELGLLGLLAFVWLLWRYFKSAYVASRRAVDPLVQALAVGSIGTGLALAAQAFTYSLESSKILWLTFGLGVVAYRLSAEGDADRRSEGSGSE